MISIYDPARVVSAAEDIRTAAEPIYRALRSSTVAEVFAAHRQAQQLAIAAARTSSEATQAAAKAVTERTIAALVGIGGLVLSKIVVPAISPQLYMHLATGLSVFLFLMAGWAWLIEGRFVASPIENFIRDIDKLADVLSDEQRSSIKKSQHGQRRPAAMHW